eukprot:TRINITY_DN7814_c0_g1_i1.p1 TRINITY_DN7814_c0_g1~~TRINITY_DN7814_c0_g1_i1.p1  ORF type:complete len:553 (+),score=113.40 TRINITY_DN7814_c0_g1_i1:57-1715(+)
MSRSTPKCGQCEQERAKVSCTQCGEVYCLTCSDKIHAKGKLKTHVVTPIGGSESDLATSLLSEYYLCPSHPQEKMNFFCQNDQKIVCTNCLLYGEHKGHVFMKLEDAMKQLHKQLDDGHDDLSKSKSKLQDQRHGLLDVQDKFESLLFSAVNMIEEDFEAIKKELDIKKASMVQTVEAFYKGKMSSVQNQICDLENVIGAIDQRLDRIKDSKSLTQPHSDIPQLLGVISLVESMNIRSQLPNPSQPDELFEFDPTPCIDAIRRLTIESYSENSFFRRNFGFFSRSNRHRSYSNGAGLGRQGVDQDRKRHSLDSLLAPSGQQLPAFSSNPPARSPRKEQSSASLAYHQNRVESTNPINMEAPRRVYSATSPPRPQIAKFQPYIGQAIYSFEAENEDEISFNAGDIIEVHAEHDGGWWIGAVGVHIGFFPANYIRKLETCSTPKSHADPLPDPVPCEIGFDIDCHPTAPQSPPLLSTPVFSSLSPVHELATSFTKPAIPNHRRSGRYRFSKDFTFPDSQKAFSSHSRGKDSPSTKGASEDATGAPRQADDAIEL